MDLNIYRPADNTSAAIRIAMARAQQDAVGFDARITSAKANRDELLLGDDPAALKKAEAQLTEARGDAERLEAIAQHLLVRLTAAVRQERLDLVEAARRELSEANSAINHFVTEHGHSLAGLLAGARAAWERCTSAEAAHRRIQTEAVRDFYERNDTETADRVASGNPDMASIAVAAEPLMLFLGRAPLVPEFIAAFPPAAEQDKRGAARMWPRRAQR